jgi:hypothetical protein
VIAAVLKMSKKRNYPKQRRHVPEIREEPIAECPCAESGVVLFPALLHSRDGSGLGCPANMAVAVESSSVVGN